MPYSKNGKLPDSAKNLTDKQKEVFVAVANSVLKDGGSEAEAIASGLSQAKKLKKSFTEALGDAIESVIAKYFGASEQPSQQQEIVSEEMVSYEVVYEPFVKDAHGEWMSDVTLEQACENFNKNLKAGVVQPNLFHLKNTDTFTIEDSWIQKEFDVVVQATGEVIKAGTWVCKIKYNDEHLWNLKKAGVVGGVSIGARGTINKETGEITNVTFDGDIV